MIKAVKDVTIWLGEITVLPSDEGSAKERLKHGLYKATLGKVDTRRRDVEEGSDEDGDSSIHELHPGLAKIFGRRGGRKVNKKGRKDEDRLAGDFEESEKVDETKAREKGDRPEEGKVQFSIRSSAADLK